MGVLLFGGSADRLSEDRISALTRAAAPLDVVITDDPDEWEKHLPQTRVAARSVPVQLLERAPLLKWSQHWAAGVEGVVASDALRSRGVLVTNASGVHAEPMAEQVFAVLLSLARGLHRSVIRQTARDWPRHTVHKLWELAGKTIMIAGLGAIGTRIAELAEAFDMKVVGIRRSPGAGGRFSTASLADLPRVLPTADIVVCVLPLTDQTRRVFNAAAFAAMRPGAIFVNLGRGGQVDQPALVAALQSGHLGGAALDVTDPEPLPGNSPLWGMENVIITPHMGGLTPEYDNRVWSILLENLRRFNSGEDLINQVDYDTGY